MSENPYVFSGFGEGFLRGLEITYRQQDRERDARRIESAERRAEMEHGVNLRRLSLEEKKLQNEVNTQPTAEEAAAMRRAGVASAEARAMKDRADAAEAFDKVETARERRKAVMAGAQTEEVEAMISNIADLMEDQEFLDDGEAIDNMVNGGKVSNPQEATQLKPRILRWGNKALKPILKKGVGETINPKTAKENNIPEGSVIVDKGLADVLIDQEEGNAAFMLVVTAEGPDGQIYRYMAPMTKNRSTARDDTIHEIPLSKLEKMAQAGGMYAHVAKNAGVPPSQLKAWIKGVTQAGTMKDKWVSAGKNRVFNQATGEYKDFPDSISAEAFLRANTQVYLGQGRELGFGGEGGVTPQSASATTQQLAGQPTQAPAPQGGEAPEGTVIVNANGEALIKRGKQWVPYTQGN